jgi:hypothetical protein
MPSFDDAFPLSMVNGASLAQAALAYAAAGIPVFPLVPANKQPLVPSGFYAATTDPATIAGWWRREPRANIGVACGEPSGWWVIDIDPRHDGWSALQQLHQDSDLLSLDDGPVSSLLYGTRRQLTGGDGAHLLFRLRRNLTVTLTSTANFASYQGIDYKGNRSYIVVAPSVHPSGKRYQWLNDAPLVPFPNALVALWIMHRQARLAAQPRAQKRRISASPWPTDHAPWCKEPQYYLKYALSQAITGQRHRYALYLACRLVLDVGLDWNEAAPWMLEYVACVSAGDHPYTEDEAFSALDWAVTQATAA